MESDKVEAIRRAQAAFSRGDLGGLRDVTADHVKWGTTGTWPGMETLYEGPGAVERGATDLRSVWESLEVGIDDVLAETANCVVVVERLKGRGAGSGVDVERRVFAVYCFEHGKIVSRTSFADKLPALEAVGLRE